MAAPESQPLKDEKLFEDGAFNVNEFAHFIGASRSYVYKLMESGAVPYAVVAGRRKVPRRAAVRLLEHGLVQKG